MDFTTIIKTVAPWIGTAITGPLGGLAIDAACSAFGLTDKTTETLKNAVSGATPEQLLALKNADRDFSLKMQELGFKQETDLASIAGGDRKDARNLLIQLKSWVPAVLSIVVTLGYFSLLYGLMKGELKVQDSQALILMLGSLTTAWASVMAFWFGTTSAGERKTEIIAQSTPSGTIKNQI